MINILDKAVKVGLMVVIVFTTLALGTVEAWSIAIFQLIVLALAVLWAAKAILEKHLEIKIPPAGLPLAAFTLLGLAQSIAVTGTNGQTTSMSMDVEATRGAVVTIFFLFLAFLIAANFFDNLAPLRTLANFLTLFGLALAVFAMIQHFTWEGKMYWFRAIESAGAGTGGPFVNRNHFAGYMEMLIPIPLALALSRGAVRNEARLFSGFAAAIMSIALVASLSRGGMLGLLAGLLFLAAVTVSQRRPRSHSAPGPRSAFRLALVIIVMLVAIAAGIVWIGADFDVLNRLTNDPLTTNAATDRRGVWGDALTMFRANPIFGIGLGAFETVYPYYGRGDGSFVVQFAHNDYLQVLSDGGVVGGAIALWFLLVIARGMAQASKASNPFMRALGIGSAAGVFALLVHSIFDFNLQIPSNALLFLVLSAIVLRVSSEERSEARDETHTRIRSAAFAGQ
ncbi:MAG TPA: O-antigen ligase family protein [Blastocatellia bacterium]|nr:O-antigen ligase family protein [Blastocatellia bacterium]